MCSPCPCWGYLTFDEEACGTFEICPVCYWEDESVQNGEADCDGGAGGISLNEALLDRGLVIVLPKYPQPPNAVAYAPRPAQIRPDF
ncbi:MAG: hypothetical protein ACI8XC_000021 [Gammaproteobacteria bacterium]|jgi:hypothetical protein